MKKRYKHITLFDQPFILDTKETIGYTPIPARDIYDVYTSCSYRKQAIWNFWKRWFIENNGNCDVCSHNCNFFSIQGYVRDTETRKMYFCYITHSNNRCILVDNDTF